MNPDAESTSTPSGTSPSPAPDALKQALFHDHLLYKVIALINHYKRDYSTQTMVPPSDQKEQAQLSL